MLQKFFIVLVLCMLTLAAKAGDATYDHFMAYLLSWNSIVMNNESPQTVRKTADVITESSDHIYVNGLAHILGIDSIRESKMRVKGQFTLHLVLDFYSGKKKVTFLSDGAQLCTLDLNHCIDLNGKFKHRFDPAYD